MRTERQRFWSKVDMNGACWEWTAATYARGYGRFSYAGGKHVLAHRYAYELHFGPIPEGALVLHHCDNRNCVKPDHLYLGDHAQNMRDRHERGREAGVGKTSCKHGHPYDDENTGRYPSTGRRYCKACDRIKHRRAQRTDAA